MGGRKRPCAFAFTLPSAKPILAAIYVEWASLSDIAHWMRTPNQQAMMLGMAA